MVLTCNEHGCRILRALIGFVLLNSAPDAWSATHVWRERERTYHVLHYALDLRIDQKLREVSGTVRLRFSPLRTLSALDVDAADMRILGVRAITADTTGPALPFSPAPTGIRIDLPGNMGPGDTATVAISYAATPATGLFFIRPDSSYPSLPFQVWSQGEMEQNHYWFPCYDYPNDKASVEMRVTVDEQYRAVSNGALLSVTKNPMDHTATYFWYCAKPIASYLISLVIGDYVTVADHYRSIPLSYNVYPPQKDDALRSFGHTPAMMAFYAGKTGFDYPWPKYAQTVVSGFAYGGMENASATTLTDRTIHDARADLDATSDKLVAHELAHQWFGDLLTCRDWANAWLNEGFATYFEWLNTDATLGPEDYEREIMTGQDTLVSIDTGSQRRPTVSDSFEDPEDLFDARIYARGACILTMLRSVLGDRVFWEGMKHYVDLNQYQCVTTDDFERAMEDAAHCDLGWFFDEWVYRAGYPIFDVSMSYDSPSSLLRLDVRQRQQVDSLTPLFRMPVRILVSTSRGIVDSTVWIEAAVRQQLALPVSDAPLNVVFDEGGRVLKKLLMAKPLVMWEEQLRHGDAVDRIRALDSLAPWLGQPGVVAAVSAALREDAFWGVRQKAAEVLGKAPEGVHPLAPAFSDRDARVRAAATTSLGHFKTLDALVALGNLFAHDSSYAVEAAALESLVAIDSAHALGYCERGLEMPSHDDLIGAAAAKALGSLRTIQAKTRLFLLTAYGQPPDVRSAALLALAQNWPGDPGVERRLGDLVGDKLFSTQRMAVECLSRFPDPVAQKILTDVRDRNPLPLLRREARRSLDKIRRVAGFSEEYGQHKR